MRIVEGRIVSLFLLIFASVAMADAQTPAFPGAEGFGKYSQGGRGGRIIKVTNLNDSGSGSLREALSASGPRIVVFETGGTIELRKPLQIENPYITVAGQTAPGDGICIKNSFLNIKGAGHVIIQGLRIRPGGNPEGGRTAGQKGIQIGRGSRNIIIDHCSVSWTVDTGIATWEHVRNVTIQNCIVSEMIHRTDNRQGAQGHGMSIGASREKREKSLDNPKADSVTVYRNLFAHIMARIPKVHYFTELMNNVVYDWGRFAVETNMVAQLDMVGNVFIPGPSTIRKQIVTMMEPDARMRIYYEDNQAPDVGKDNQEQLAAGSQEYRSQKRIRASGTVPFPSQGLVESVLSGVGATAPHRDAIDERIVTDVRKGTGQIISSEEDVGGYPSYATGTPPADTDDDGIPDAWEEANGLNSSDPSDAATVRDMGFTNLEIYLNSFFSDGENK